MRKPEPSEDAEEATEKLRMKAIRLSPADQRRLTWLCKRWELQEAPVIRQLLRRAAAEEGYKE